MACDCKKDLEAKLTERFVAGSPEAAEHKVELQGYGLAAVGRTIKVLPFMTAKGTARFPLKNGNTKVKSVMQTMVFSYCPFCGVALETAATEGA